MSYRSDLKCMADFMVERIDSGKRVWFILPDEFPVKCHNCDRRVICRRTLSEYAEIINEDAKVKEAEDCCRLVDGVCELGYQACAVTMFHPNCKDRKTCQPETIGDRLISTARSIGH